MQRGGLTSASLVPASFKERLNELITIQNAFTFPLDAEINLNARGVSDNG